MARHTQIYIFFSIFTFSIISVDSLRCVQKSACSCEYEDGKIIDLQELSSKPFLIASNANLTYFFHGCSNSKPDIPNNINIISNECTNSSICLLNTTSINATVIDIGHAEDTKFSFEGNSENCLVFNINKHNLTTVITLSCADYRDSVLHFDSINKLILFSPLNCAVYKHHGLSTGSVLVIMLIILTSAYFFGGATVLHFLRGARGKEMIPNFDFWIDLPTLVRDGALFLQNGCKPIIITTSDSYDRI